jgi:hypothetical protein
MRKLILLAMVLGLLVSGCGEMIQSIQDGTYNPMTGGNWPRHDNYYNSSTPEQRYQCQQEVNMYFGGRDPGIIAYQERFSQCLRFKLGSK